MKLILKRLVPGLLLFGLLTTSALAQTRIATVDLRKLFENYYKTKIADAALKDRAAEMDKSHNEMLNDWKKAKEEYQKLLMAANDQAISSRGKRQAHEGRGRQAEGNQRYRRGHGQVAHGVEVEAGIAAGLAARRIPARPHG